MEKEIIRTAKDVVNVTENDEKLEMTHTHYPIAPYSNHVATEVVFYKKDGVVKVYRVRQDWNGTGSDHIAYVELREAEFHQLLDVARKVKSVGDFVDLVNEIERLQEKMDVEVAED